MLKSPLFLILLKLYDSYAFDNCILKTLEIPNGNAYCYCEKYQKIEIPTDSRIQIIQKDTFKNTLIKSIYIPPKIMIIEKEAFAIENF